MKSHVEFLHWDSEFFGFKIGKVQEGCDMAESLREAKDHSYRLVYCYLSPQDQEVKKELENNGAKLVDKRVMYAQDVHPSWKDWSLDSKLSSGIGVSLTPELESLAIACGHHSRFSMDPGIPQSLFEKMYSIWMRKSLEGNTAVEVYLYGGQNGLCTVRDFNERADIGLIGVHKSLRGQGVGRKMMAAAMRYAATHQYPVLQVATQVDNAGACAFYETLGFQVDHRSDIYHLWL